MDIYTFQKIKAQENPSWKEQEQIEVLEIEQENNVLVVHNDDFNTFDFVIDSLMEICEHTPEQAEQCTWLIHYKGKCEVKTGALEDLMPRHQKLLSRGLTSEIL